MSLYNELRPKTLKEIVGQEKTVEILANELSKEIIHNAYLLVGERGTGKTTIARILAKSFNCEHPKDGCGCGICASCKEIASGSSMDVFELDAASNNGVDNIRDILEQVQFKPVRKKKVFILDEVHMLSNAASNALLKVLEEPPADVVFILATTERHKVLPTIKSRCATYEFEKIPKGLIESYMKKICADKSVEVEDAALGIIAKAARGGMRDALSMLDQFLSKDKILAKDVAETLGMTTEESIFTLLGAYAKRNVDTVVSSIRELSAKGVSMAYLIEVMCDVLLDAVCLRMTGSASDIVGTEEYVSGVADLAQELDEDRAFRLLDELREIYKNRAAGVESALMGALIHISTEDVRLANIEQRLFALESRPAVIADAVPPVQPGVSQDAPVEVEAADDVSDIEADDTEVEDADPAPVGSNDLEAESVPADDSIPNDDGFYSLEDDFQFDCPFDEDPVDLDALSDSQSDAAQPAQMNEAPTNVQLSAIAENQPEAELEAKPKAESKIGPKVELKAEVREEKVKTISFDELQANLAGDSQVEVTNSEPEMDLFSGFARLFGAS